MELVLLLVIATFAFAYRSSQNQTVAGTTKYLSSQAKDLYDKVAPFSYKQMRAKIKDMGEDFTPKQFIRQVLLFAGLASVISYLYFYQLGQLTLVNRTL